MERKRNILIIFIAVFQIFFLVVITGFAKAADYTLMDWRWVPVIFLFLCVVADVILISYIMQMRERKDMEQKNLLMNQELENQLRHYNAVIQRLENTARFRHDFRNQMQTIYILIERKEYQEASDMLEALSKSIQEAQI